MVAYPDVLELLFLFRKPVFCGSGDAGSDILVTSLITLSIVSGLSAPQLRKACIHRMYEVARKALSLP